MASLSACPAGLCAPQQRAAPRGSACRLAIQPQRTWQQQRGAQAAAAARPPAAAGFAATDSRRSPAARGAVPAAAAAAVVCVAAAAPVATAQVVLTREQGKNGALRKVLELRGISCLELPMVETTAGPDRERLPQVLAERAAEFDWVCITSPEAASVFLEGWRAAGRPRVRLAVVGEGTGRVFAAAAADGAPQPEFVPTVANAEHFGPELPFVEGGSGRVLYPASNKASTELQGGLIKRGFVVERLNTYDTVPVARLDGAALEAARGAAVVTVGSPSAIKAWVQLVGAEPTERMAIACIGSTSARAAEKLGLKNIKYPDAPGVDTWAEVVEECLREVQAAA